MANTTTLAVILKSDIDEVAFRILDDHCDISIKNGGHALLNR